MNLAMMRMHSYFIYPGQTGVVEADVQSRLAVTYPPLSIAGAKRTLLQRHTAAPTEAAATAATATTATTATASTITGQSHAGPPKVGHESRP